MLAAEGFKTRAIFSSLSKHGILTIGEIITFSLAALFCEVVGTVGGFGSSVFFVPLAGFFFPQKVVLGLTGVFHVFSNISKLILFWRNINWRVTLLFGIPGVLMVALGAWFSTWVHFQYMELALGIFLISFSLFFLFIPSVTVSDTPVASVTGGSIAGFLAGMIGTGGAVRGLALTAYNLEKNAFVATSAAVDMGVDATRTAIYLGHSFLQIGHLWLIPLLLVISWLGSWIGKMILGKIDQLQFRRTVLILILLIGIITILKYYKIIHV